MENKSYKERVAEILGLETDPHGQPNFLLTRDEDGEILEGADFNDEVEAIDQLNSQALDNQMKEVMEMIEKLKKSSEKFVPFQKIHYLSALEDLSSLIDKEK